jgi:hypothetical protein
MIYTTCISINDALFFDLFDEIEFKYLKGIFTGDDDYDEHIIPVIIKITPHECDCCANAKMDYEIEGIIFTRSFMYRKSYPIGLKLEQIFEFADTEYDSEDEDVYEDVEEEEEPTSVMDLRQPI